MTNDGLREEFFPVQVTSEPDPIRALNEWALSNLELEDMAVYGSLSEWEQAGGKPAVYWRTLQMTTSDEELHDALWFDCRIAGHVFSDNATERLQLLKAIIEKLGMADRLVLTDESTLTIAKVTIKPFADQMSEGQITVEGRYGVVRVGDEYSGDLLTKVTFS